VNLALLHRQQRNWAAAKRLLLEGRPHHLAALKVNPRRPVYRPFYRNHLGVLTTVHARLLEPEDAVRTAQTCRDLGWDAPADAYDACFLSLCVPIVAEHDNLDDKQRQEAAQFYGDAAIRLLRDAVSKGYKDVAHMKKDTDLDPLRQREDYKRIVADLEGNGKEAVAALPRAAGRADLPAEKAHRHRLEGRPIPFYPLAERTRASE
jgi:hypothetical protein